MKEGSYLLMVCVYQEKFFDDVLLALTGLGVKDICSISGVNESRRLPINFPFFSGFKEKLGKSSSMSKMFLAAVQDPKLVKTLLSLLKQVDIKFVEDNIGAIFLLPLTASYP